MSAEETRRVEPVEAPPPPQAPETELLAEVARAGTLEVVQIDDLNVDHSYQRDLNSDLVQRISGAYDMAVAGTVVISRRPNGSLWVVDGAHRVAGAKLAGETEMLAQVLTGLTAQEEAELRLRGNVKRTDKSAERFKAQVAAGWPESKAITDLCEQFDTRININPDAKHGINAIAAVEEIYRRNKGILLARVFEMIRDAYGTIGGRTATVALLKALAWLIERHDAEMDRGRMIERMGRMGLDNIEQRARSHKAVRGGALWMNYYRTLLEIYNERLNPSNVLHERTTGSSRVPVSGWGDD